MSSLSYDNRVVPTALICVPSLTFVSKSHWASTLRLHCCDPATSSCCSSCLTLLLDNVNGPCCSEADDVVDGGSGSDLDVNRPEVSKLCPGSSVVNFLPPRWNVCCCCCCCCSWRCCSCCCRNIPSKPARGCWSSSRCCCTVYLLRKPVKHTWVGRSRDKSWYRDADWRWSIKYSDSISDRLEPAEKTFYSKIIRQFPAIIRVERRIKSNDKIIDILNFRANSRKKCPYWQHKFRKSV